MSAVKQEGYVFLSAGTDQLRDIVELKLAMFHDAGVAHLLARDAADRILSSYRELYTCNRAAHFLAVHDGRIAGMAGAFIKSDIPYCYFDPPLYGFIGDIYTVPEHRRRGLARALSWQALDWLRSQPVAAVRLLASSQGRAIYEELGFAPSDEMVLTFD